MGSIGRVIEYQIINQGVGGSDPPADISKQRQSYSPHLPVFFGRDTKIQWSLMPGVYTREAKDPTQGVNV